MAVELYDTYSELIGAWRPPVMPSGFTSAQEILQYIKEVEKSSGAIGLPLIGRVVKRIPSNANEVSRLEVLTCLDLYGGRTEAIRETDKDSYSSGCFGSGCLGRYLLVEESELNPAQKTARDKIIERVKRNSEKKEN